MLIEQLRGVLIEAVNGVAFAVINDLKASSVEQPVPTTDGGLGLVSATQPDEYTKSEYDWRDREARTTAFMQTNPALPLGDRIRDAAQIAAFIRQGITPAERAMADMNTGSAKRASRSEDEVMEQVAKARVVSR